MKTKKIVIVSSLIFIFGNLVNAAYAETWSVTEGVNYEWVGQWTKQGNTNKFSCEQRSSHGLYLTARIIINENGQMVSAQKLDSSDGNNCNYSGVRNEDAIEGTYFCSNGGPYKWSARISNF